MGVVSKNGGNEFLFAACVVLGLLLHCGCFLHAGSGSKRYRRRVKRSLQKRYKEQNLDEGGQQLMVSRPVATVESARVVKKKSMSGAELKQEMCKLIAALDVISTSQLEPSAKQELAETFFKKSISLLKRLSQSDQLDESGWFDCVSQLQVPLSIMASNAKRWRREVLIRSLDTAANVVSDTAARMPMRFGSLRPPVGLTQADEYTQNPHPTQLLSILFSGLYEKRLRYQHKSLRNLIEIHSGLRRGFLELVRLLVRRGANPHAGFAIGRQTFCCSLECAEGCTRDALGKKTDLWFFWSSVEDSLRRWRYDYLYPRSTREDERNMFASNVIDQIKCQEGMRATEASRFERKTYSRVGSMLGPERALKWKGVLLTRRA